MNWSRLCVLRASTTPASVCILGCRHMAHGVAGQRRAGGDSHSTRYRVVILGEVLGIRVYADLWRCVDVVRCFGMKQSDVRKMRRWGRFCDGRRNPVSRRCEIAARRGRRRRPGPTDSDWAIGCLVAQQALTANYEYLSIMRPTVPSWDYGMALQWFRATHLVEYFNVLSPAIQSLSSPALITPYIPQSLLPSYRPTYLPSQWYRRVLFLLVLGLLPFPPYNFVCTIALSRVLF